MKNIKEIVYFVIDYKIIVFLVCILFAFLFVTLSADRQVYSSVKLLLSSAASVGFTLFGFTIASLAILATLKTTPFLQRLELSNKKIFKQVIDYFIVTAIFLFVFGVIGLTISPEIFSKDVSVLNNAPIKNYRESIGAGAILFFSSVPLFLSINCLALLRLLVLGNDEDATN